jgi:hypothetical protein
MGKFVAFVLFAAACVGLAMMANPGLAQQTTSLVFTVAPSAAAQLAATNVAGNLRGIQAQGTNQAVVVTADAIRAQQTDDAFNYYAQQTAESMWSTQQAEAEQRLTAEAQAELTRQAADQATAQAWEIIGWTATADVVQATSQAQQAATATTQAYSMMALTVTADVANAQATARAQSTLDAYLAGSLERARQREELTNTMLALGPYVVIGLLIILAVWILALAVPAMVSRAYDRQPDAAGRYPLIADRHGNVYDADRNPGPIARLDKRNPRVIVVTSEAIQAAVTMRDQLVDLATRGHPNQPRAALPAKTTEQLSAPAAAPVTAPDVRVLPEIAPWALLDQWTGGKLPLGISSSGPVQHDPDGTAPHLLFAGTTGSGKTRYGLRPVICEALADHWQVIMLDAAGGVDLGVFRDHPNAHLVEIDGPADAIKVLKAVYGQLKQRLAQLGSAGVSTWGRWDNQGPRILIVIDEFSNLADDAADAGEREELWRRARMIAAEGRKAGILLAIALQDPTHKSMDLRIRRNCTRVAFRVQDMDASRVVLGSDGAQHLAPHRFMTVAGQLVEGVAFDPSDLEITRFLQRRPVAALPAPAWLDAPIEQDEQALSEEDRARKIIELHSGGASLNEIQRQVFGFTGGQAYSAVKAVLLRSTGTDTGIDTNLNQNIAPSAA